MDDVVVVARHKSWVVFARHEIRDPRTRGDHCQDLKRLIEKLKKKLNRRDRGILCSIEEQGEASVERVSNPGDDVEKRRKSSVSWPELEWDRVHSAPKFPDRCDVGALMALEVARQQRVQDSERVGERVRPLNAFVKNGESDQRGRLSANAGVLRLRKRDYAPTKSRISR
jgi:hypothetical protein